MNNSYGAKTIPAKIEEAYTELSSEAFAIWIRLMVAPDHLLEGGRKNLAPILGYSMGRCNEILRELKNKGYIRLVKAEEVGEPTLIVLLRPAMISGRNRFIRLANALMAVASEHDTVVCPVSVPAFQLAPENTKPSFVESLTGSSEREANTDIDASTVLRDLDTTNLVRQVQTNGGEGSIVLEEVVNHLHSIAGVVENHCSLMCLSNTLEDQPSEQTGMRQKPVKMRLPPPDLAFLDQLRGVKSAHESRDSDKLETEEGNVSTERKLGHRLETDDGCENRLRGSLDIEKIRQIREAEKKSKSDRARAGAAKAKQHAHHPKKPAKLDWAKIDLRGQPAIRWDMDDAQRSKMNAVLARSDRDWEKRQLVNKLASEFRRYYTRYRREIQEANGNKASYRFVDAEMRYARQAAILCLAKCVTPRQLLEYWHVNVGNFADRKMKVPPLSFLAAPANIDTVSCAIVEGDKGRRWRPGDFTKETNSHSFSDVASLDKRLRPALERAGFAMREFNDRHLMTIQNAAKAKAKGRAGFISAEMRPMVEVVVTLLTEGEDAIKAVKKPTAEPKAARSKFATIDEDELDDPDWDKDWTE